MESLQLKGKRKYKQGTVSMNVPVVLFEEDNIWYAYLPSFDLTGYGNNIDEAQESLTIVLDEFIRYTLKKNTFFIVLRRLGWDIKSRNKPIKAPKMSDLVEENDQLKNILDTKQFSTIKYPVDLPAYA